MPEGRIRFCARDRIHDIRGRQAFGLQCVQVKIDLDLTLFAAIGIRNAGAIDGYKLCADEVQAVIVELLLGEPLAGKIRAE